MADKAQHATTRKIPRIVFERPAFSRRRFWLFLGASFLIALLLGLGLNLLHSLGADGVGTYPEDFPRVYRGPRSWEFVPVLLLLGIGTGVALGWAWKRSVTTRIAMLEPPPQRESRRRRRSTSTSLSRA